MTSFILLYARLRKSFNQAICVDEEELARQNQTLFKDLEETRNNYEMVSEFYDKACQDAGATKKNIESSAETPR